jgi:hypothetical protein
LAAFSLSSGRRRPKDTPYGGGRKGAIRGRKALFCGAQERRQGACSAHPPRAQGA